MIRKITFIPLFALLIMLTACASSAPPSFGTKVQNESAETAKIGKSWIKGDMMISEGNALIIAGNKEIKKAEKLLAKGKANVRKGEAMVKKGAFLRQEAEETYQLNINKTSAL